MTFHCSAGGDTDSANKVAEKLEELSVKEDKTVKEEKASDAKNEEKKEAKVEKN